MQMADSRVKDLDAVMVVSRVDRKVRCEGDLEWSARLIGPGHLGPFIQCLQWRSESLFWHSTIQDVKIVLWCSAIRNQPTLQDLDGKNDNDASALSLEM